MRLYALLLSLLLMPNIGAAASRVALSLAIDFEPTSASCVVTVSDRLSVIQALYLPEEGNGDDMAMRNWLFACAVPDDVDVERNISVVIGRSDGPSIVKSGPGKDFFPLESTLDSEEKARQVLSKQRELLASFTVQVKAQERELNRLRGDADLVGQNGSIGEAERGVQERERQLAELKRDILSLETAVREIRSGAAPLNAAVIEVDMTKQLAELAQAARGAEATERERSSTGEGQLNDTMRLIEETRFDDIETIRADLVKMRKHRQELEEALQGDSQAPLDYE